MLEGADSKCDFKSVDSERLTRELVVLRDSSNCLLNAVDFNTESMKASAVVEKAAAFCGAADVVKPLRVDDPTVYREVLRLCPELKACVHGALVPVLKSIEAASKVLVINVADIEVAEQTGRVRWHNDQVLASKGDFPLGDGPYMRMANKLLDVSDDGKIKNFAVDLHSRLGKTLLKLKKANDDCLRLLGH